MKVMLTRISVSISQHKTELSDPKIIPSHYIMRVFIFYLSY